MDDYHLFSKIPYENCPLLACGWENRGNSFIRPLNEVPAGTICFGAGLELPDDISAEIEFLNSDLQVLHSVHVPSGKDSFLSGSFEQQGDLAAVQITPSEPVVSDSVQFSRPFLLTANRAIDETFSYTPENGLPEKWQGSNAGVYALPCKVCLKVDGKAGFDRDTTENVLRILPGGSVTPYVNRALLTDSYIFEFDAWVDAGTDFVFGGLVLREQYNFADGIWYHFRLEVQAGKVLLKLNGREIVNGLSLMDFQFKNLSAEKELLIDDVRAYALEFPADYVPEPKIPAGYGTYNLGVSVCPLWCNGHHWAWRCIDRCGDREPVLGFYDEGLPETADWEIKYLVESGITCQAFCWYPESHDGPIHHPRMDTHLCDGLKNARYSHLMKYCLIWEVENAGRPHTLEMWQKNYIPYLIEHHFKDPRYMTLDNKPVMVVFGSRHFLTEPAFGTPEKTREAFALLDKEVQKLGFDGVIWIDSHCHVPELAAMGYSATINYNQGYEGYKVSVNKERNLYRASEIFKGLMPIPTISVGFDSLPWHGIKRPLITKEDYREAILWAKDEFLPEHAEKGTWQEKTFWLSTWNEYGEGTYIMPTKTEDGFRYLDVVRSIFTEEPADADWHTVPTEEQEKRINRLYPRIGHPLVRSRR